MNRLLPWLFVLGFVVAPAVLVARRLLEELPRRTVVACARGQSEGHPATLATLSGGGILDVSSMLDRPDSCLPAGITVEKPRWRLRYRVGQTEKDWPFGMLMAMMAAGLAVFAALMLRQRRA